ncbi:MAG: hypothetical protein ACO3E1_01945 [Flavobacteriales bacterium]
MKKIFKIISCFFVFSAAVFITFNLMISALLPTSHHVKYDYSTQRQPVKKILCVVKYIDNNYSKYKQVCSLDNVYLGAKKKESLCLNKVKVLVCHSTLPFCCIDYPIRYCSLLI